MVRVVWHEIHVLDIERTVGTFHHGDKCKTSTLLMTSFSNLSNGTKSLIIHYFRHNIPS